MNIENDGYRTGLLIILSMLMLGMLLGGSLFTYSVYDKHQMVLQMARDSEMEARMAVDRMEDSARREAVISANVQVLQARISELEAENAELREHLPEQEAD